MRKRKHSRSLATLFKSDYYENCKGMIRKINPLLKIPVGIVTEIGVWAIVHATVPVTITTGTYTLSPVPVTILKKCNANHKSHKTWKR